jgi:hypothetical protein
LVDSGSIRFAQTKECACYESAGIAPGGACTGAIDCQLLCCSCACEARGYSAAACIDQKCSDAETACALTLSEAMPVEGTALCE